MSVATRVRVVVQARMTSTRLPGKSLLPVAGIPLAVLVLTRASSTGLDVVLATSDEASDDELTSVVRAAGFPVVRGSRLDVLDRFLSATTDLHDHDVVVRLTADNPLPDGDLIDDLVASLTGSDDAYRYIDQSSVPYGLSAEAFRVHALRAAAASQDLQDREHVTRWIRREAPAKQFRPALPPRTPDGLRCTIDLPGDYEAVATLMAGRATAGWRELVIGLS